MLKRCLVSTALAMAGVMAQAAPLWGEQFNDVAALAQQGWVSHNLSQPPGREGWFQGNAGVFKAADGQDNGYVASNYNAASEGGSLSNWLLTPVLQLGQGAALSFTWRASLEGPFFDRLEVYLSTSGASSDVGETAQSTGDFNWLGSLSSAGQAASAWRSVNIDLGLGSGELGRIGFRYVGQSDIANYLGLDDVQVTNAVLAATPVPEPGTVGLLALGLVVLAGSRRARVRRWHSADR
jgi:hypothetical protein